MEKRQLIAALVEKTGIKLTEDDPAFLLVDLNLLVLERYVDEAAKRLGTATEKFEAVTTQNVDNFVGVANEALSKFKQSTQALISTVETIKPPTVTAPSSAQKGMSWWVISAVFSTGIAIGMLLSLWVTK